MHIQALHIEYRPWSQYRYYFHISNFYITPKSYDQYLLSPKSSGIRLADFLCQMFRVPFACRLRDSKHKCIPNNTPRSFNNIWLSFFLPRSHSQQVAGCKSLYPGTAAKILTVTRRYGDMGLACAVSFPAYQNSVYWVWSSSVMGHTLGNHVQLGSPLGVPNDGISGKIQKLQRCQAGQILHDCLTGEMVHFSGPSHGTSFWGIIWNTLWSFNVAD